MNLLFEASWERLGLHQTEKRPQLLTEKETQKETPAFLREEPRPKTEEETFSETAETYERFFDWQRKEDRRKLKDLTVEPEEW